jgi:hypothetical protein
LVLVTYEVNRKEEVFACGMNFTALNLLRVDDLVVNISVSISDFRLQIGKERKV